MPHIDAERISGLLPPGQLTRHRCRHCRGKLPAPVLDLRQAFCCPACHAGFFRVHCQICERPMQRKSPSQKACGERECRAALKAQTVEIAFELPTIDIFHPKSNSVDISKPKSTIESHLRSPVVAGPELSSAQLHSALVPDGPGCRWAGGEYWRLEAKNRKAVERKQIEANGYFTEPDWREVVSPDGVRAWITRWRDPKPTKTSSPKVESKALTLPDDLSIPDFLCRATEIGGAR